MDTNRKKKKEGLTIVIWYYIKKEFYSSRSQGVKTVYMLTGNVSLKTSRRE